MITFFNVIPKYIQEENFFTNIELKLKSFLMKKEFYNIIAFLEQYDIPHFKYEEKLTTTKINVLILP